MKYLIIVISGPKGIGKSTFLFKLSKRLLNKFSLGGVITLGQEERNFLDIKTQKTSSFSDVITKKGIQIGKYFISEKALNFASDAIKHSLETEVIFIDEIGRLEAEQKGLFSDISRFFSSNEISKKIVILGVRQEVVPILSNLFSIHPNVVKMIEERPCEELIEEISNIVIKHLE